VAVNETTAARAAYRVWIHFQRKGVVNTVAFTIPVSALR
jgi:hypothetical protein